MSVTSTPQRIVRAVSSGSWTPSHALASYSPAPSRGVSGEGSIALVCPIMGSSRSSSGDFLHYPPPPLTYGVSAAAAAEWDSLLRPAVPTLALPSTSNVVAPVSGYASRSISGLPLSSPFSGHTEFHPSRLVVPPMVLNFDEETDDEEMTYVTTPPPKTRKTTPPDAPVASRRSARLAEKQVGK